MYDSSPSDRIDGRLQEGLEELTSHLVALPTGISTPRRMHTSTRSLAAPVSTHVNDVNRSTTGVPDWKYYKASNNGATNRTLQYFMVGSLGVLAASGAKSTVTDILSSMSASADVLALAKVEVEMGSIPEGQSSAWYRGCADVKR